MEIRNLTPHTITIVDAAGSVVRTIPASGVVARAEIAEVPGPSIDGIPTVTATIGAPVDLPEPAEGVVYVVSRIVRDAAPDRDDLYVPHGLVRDDEGRVVGCRGFAR